MKFLLWESRVNQENFSYIGNAITVFKEFITQLEQTNIAYEVIGTNKKMSLGKFSEEVLFDNLKSDIQTKVFLERLNNA